MLHNENLKEIIEPILKHLENNVGFTEMLPKPIPEDKGDGKYAYFTYYVYDEEIKGIYKLATDRNYLDNFEAMGNKLIADMTKQEAVTVLTFIIRQERFFEGLLAVSIEEGRVQQILKKLME